MKITMLRNAAKHFGCTLSEGETGEVEDALGAELVNARIAEHVKAEEKSVKGVAKTPAIKGE